MSIGLSNLAKALVYIADLSFGVWMYSVGFRRLVVFWIVLAVMGSAFFKIKSAIAADRDEWWTR